MKTLKIHWITLTGIGAITAALAIAAETSKIEPVPKLQAETPAAAPAELTAMRCLICHGNPAAGTKRLAPPFGMVKMHYDDLDEEAFVKAVSAWVKQPDKAKSRMPGAIRNFGLMPAQVVSDADLTTIAHYLYRTDFQMPGRGGRGMGRGPGARTSDKKPATDCKACGEGCGGSCAPAKTASPSAGADSGTGNNESPDSCIDPQPKSDSKCP